MIILINDESIGSTSSSFVYFDKNNNKLIFTSDGDDKCTASPSSNSLFRLLEEKEKDGDFIKLMFGMTVYEVTNIDCVLGEYGEEVALKAEVVSVEG